MYVGLKQPRGDGDYVPARAAAKDYILYQHTNDKFYGRFSEDFRTLSEDSLKLSCLKARQLSPNIFRKFPRKNR